MMNQKIDLQIDDDERDAAPAWRSIGSLASGWAARIEAQREKEAMLEALDFVPTAWAAE